MAIEAAKAGKHLLLDKPVATSIGAAQGLADAAQDVASVVFFTDRFGGTPAGQPNGAAGMVATRNGVVFTIASIIVRNGKITEMDLLADPERLARLDLTILDGRD